MKPTDFAYYLTNFLSKYLPGIIGLSSNTIISYRDSFCLFLNYCSVYKKIKPEKFSLNHLKKDLIIDYLDWIEKEKNCLTSTRNVRLSAFHSFSRYLQLEFPDYIHWGQEILSIPIKKTKKKLSII
jgi:integrase/recombinase XerD